MSVELKSHHAELARAAAAAMQQNYQEAIDICSELLTSGIYGDLAAADPLMAKRAQAETRLLMATAMHYNDGHEEDILRVLKAALDSPEDVRKDVLFTTAVVQLSFGHKPEAQSAIAESLALLAKLRTEQGSSPELDEREAEAKQFLSLLQAQ